MSVRNDWKELIGMRLYLYQDKYFYAWNANHALKKLGKVLNESLFIINDYGEKIECNLKNQ